MTQRLRWVLLGAFAAAVFAGGGAWATTHVFGDGGTLHACAQKLDGQLRLVQAGETCRNNEAAVTWNVQGPQGPKGDSGGGLTSVEDLVGLPCTTPFGRGEFWLVNTDGFQHTLDLVPKCMAPDVGEPNETEGTASPPPAQSERTIWPQGDEDWFVLSDTTLNGVYLNREAGADVEIELYVDGQLAQRTTNTLQAYNLGRHTFVWHVTSTGQALYYGYYYASPL